MSGHWDRIQDLFHRATAMDVDSRESFLKEECGDDHVVLSEVLSLLHAGEEVEDAAPTTPMPVPPSPRDSMIGTKVARYTIKRVIGSGGMGVVYDSVQESPRRAVAIKMLKRGVASRSELRRFQRESQTLGRLRYEGIAHIYEAGTWDDGAGSQPWFAMEYLPGAKTNTRYCNDKVLGIRDRLVVFQHVCAAVHHGHQKGVIHRDLKPDNILVTSNGEPKIIDFGVARSTDSDLVVTTLQTDVGSLIGTLQYMSPEQCDADPNDIDARSDVYALGVVLYELLCGQPPYDLNSAAIHEAVRVIKEEDPTKPSAINRRLRGSLETITLKALDKDRDHRYRDASALESDIECWLHGRPISARGRSVWDRGKRLLMRNPAKVATVLVVCLLLVVIWQLRAETDATASALRGPQAGDTQEISLGDDRFIVLVGVPKGGYWMGSPDTDEDRRMPEWPPHHVLFDRGFWIGQTEVTQEAYNAVMSANPSRSIGERELSNPVEQITWDDAVGFCEKLTLQQRAAEAIGPEQRFRLPSEAEWEYACRAGSTSWYCFGESESDLGDYAWQDHNSANATYPVAQKQPNAWGLYDMHGNVLEWCEDPWHTDYEHSPADGSVWETGGNPDSRVVRGGSWRTAPWACRSAYRSGNCPDGRYFDVGFRVVLDSR